MSTSAATQLIGNAWTNLNLRFALDLDLEGATFNFHSRRTGGGELVVLVCNNVG